MKKNYSYNEIYCLLSYFIDKQSIFADLTKQTSSKRLLSLVVYFPFVPIEISNLPASFLFDFLYSMGIEVNLSTPEAINEKIWKQKLTEVFYLVDDSPDLHGVVECRSLHQCSSLASINCANFKCRSCCLVQSEIGKFCHQHMEPINAASKALFNKKHAIYSRL